LGSRNVPSALIPDELTQQAEQEKKEKAATHAKKAIRRRQDLEKL
jgi:hypothetical protein